VDLGPTLWTDSDIIVGFLTFSWLAELADAYAGIAYPVATAQWVLGLPLQTDEAVYIGSQQLPVPTVALEALPAESSSWPPTILDVGENGYDVALDIRADHLEGQLSITCIVMDTEEAGVAVESAEDL
jgi:hypothetical protein